MDENELDTCLAVVTYVNKEAANLYMSEYLKNCLKGILVHFTSIFFGCKFIFNNIP